MLSQQSSAQKQESMIQVTITKTLQQPKARSNPKIQVSRESIRLQRRRKRDGSDGAVMMMLESLTVFVDEVK
jgi:hypothetical protein